MDKQTVIAAISAIDVLLDTLCLLSNVLWDNPFDVIEKGVEQHFSGCYSLLGVHLQHLVQQVQQLSRGSRHDAGNTPLRLSSKVIILSFELVIAFAPILQGRSSQQREYFAQLV